jgi:putative FmdB family regulatory protein
MPTYVYACSSCKELFEVEQRITESPLTSCPCGSEGTVKRVIQPVGIAFKGSGFYVNDSKTQAAPSCSGEPASCPSCAPSVDSKD